MTLPSSRVLVAIVSTVGSASAQDIAASHLEAAEELLPAAGTDTIISESTKPMIRLQAEQNSDLAPFQDILRAFLSEHLSWDAIGGDLARMYAEEFSETELREISAFYRTETGQKAVRLTPLLIERAMALGQQAVAEHGGELGARIQDRIAKMSRVPGLRKGSR